MQFSELSNEQKQRTLFRLTALWALNECGLGGLLHAFNVPFSGLALAGIALTLISLIFMYSEGNKLLYFNALIVVLLIKAILSPHSTITAYIAVAFQAGFGWLIYKLFGLRFITILVVCVISFVETATQKMITLTIIGGMPFWNAVDIFINNISLQLFSMNLEHGALWVSGIYYAIYISFAVILSFFIWNIIKRLRTFEFKSSLSFSLQHEDKGLSNKVRSKWKIMPFFLVLALVLFVLFTYYSGSRQDKILIYLLRTFLIVIIWYFFILPLSVKWLRKYLFKKLPKFQDEINRTVDFFPKIKFILIQCWEKSSNKKGLSRLYSFLTIALFEIISFE